MSFEIACPHCGQSLESEESMCGMEVDCPQCAESFIIPSLQDDEVMEMAEPPPFAEPAAAAAAASSEDSGFPNYSLYAKCTRAADWQGIFMLNGVNMDSFGTKKELAVLPQYLDSDEVVFALASGVMSQTQTSNAFDWGTNTWLVALTSERFLFLDHAMLTRSVDTQSIRHDSVQAVSASQGWMLGKIQVDLGSRTVIIDNCQKATVAVVADLANKWLSVLKKREKRAGGGGGGTSAQVEESLLLAKRQIQNQERIISLLEQIRDSLRG